MYIIFGVCISYGNCQAPIGISGMANFDGWKEKSTKSFVVVHDFKFYSKDYVDKQPKKVKDQMNQENKAGRFGLIIVPAENDSDQRSKYFSLEEDWGKLPFKANDLEGICAIPNQKN